MTEVGRGENDGQTIIAGGSEFGFDFYCEVCRDDGKHLEAAGFCVDCEEYLCGACVNSHERARPCRFHKILDTTEMPKETLLTHDRPIKTIHTRCEGHPGEPVKFYCKDHSVFGCTTCFATRHRACDGIESIVEKSEKMLDCGEFKTFIKNLNSMKQTLSSVIETVQSNIEETRQDCQNAVTSVKEFRTEIYKIIDEVEQRIIAKAHSISTEEIAKLENLLQEVRSLSEKVDTISSETEELRSSRQICQLYIKMKEMDKDIKELLCRVSDIANLKPLKRLSFQPSAELRNRFENDTAFGDLSEAEIAVRHTKDVDELNSEQVGDIAITQDDQMRAAFHKDVVGSVVMPEDTVSRPPSTSSKPASDPSAVKDSMGTHSNGPHLQENKLKSQYNSQSNKPRTEHGLQTPIPTYQEVETQTQLNCEDLQHLIENNNFANKNEGNIERLQTRYEREIEKLKQDMAIARDNRQTREASYPHSRWGSSGIPSPKRLPRYKACVQIYSHRRRNEINTITVRLGYQLQTQFDTINTDLTCITCDQKEQLDKNIPTIVLCTNKSRLSTDIASSLEGLSWTNKMVVVVLHNQNTHCLPRLPSSRLLTGTEFKSLGGLIDMAFLYNKGIYPCDINTQALAALMSFINGGRIDG